MEETKIRRATRVLCASPLCMNRVLVRAGDELPAYCSICHPQPKQS